MLTRTRWCGLKFRNLGVSSRRRAAGGGEDWGCFVRRFEDFVAVVRGMECHENGSDSQIGGRR